MFNLNNENIINIICGILLIGLIVVLIVCLTKKHNNTTRGGGGGAQPRKNKSKIK